MPYTSNRYVSAKYGTVSSQPGYQTSVPGCLPHLIELILMFGEAKNSEHHLVRPTDKMNGHRNRFIVAVYLTSITLRTVAAGVLPASLPLSVTLSLSIPFIPFPSSSIIPLSACVFFCVPTLGVLLVRTTAMSAFSCHSIELAYCRKASGWPRHCGRGIYFLASHLQSK